MALFAALTRPIGPGVLDTLYEARAALGPKAAQAKLAIFFRTRVSPALAERAAREGVLLVGVADLFA
jgi:hypothetical protein